MKGKGRSSLKNGKKTVVLFARHSFLENEAEFVKDLIERTKSYDVNFIFYDIEMLDGVTDYNEFFDFGLFDLAILSKSANNLNGGEFKSFVYSKMKHRVVEQIPDEITPVYPLQLIDEFALKYSLECQIEVEGNYPAVNPKYSELIANISDMSIIDYSYYLCNEFGLTDMFLNVYSSNTGEARNMLSIINSRGTKHRRWKYQYRYLTPNFETIEGAYSLIIAPLYYGNDNLGYMTISLKVNCLKYYGVLQSLFGNLVYSETVVKRAQLVDPLTKLSNRMYFNRRLNELIESKTKNTALMYINIEKFKKINEAVGHAKGDEILKQVADVMLKSMDKIEDVYRLNGDEFMIVLPSFKSNKEVMSFAKELISKIHSDITVEEKSISLDLNIGISVYPDDGDNATKLLHAADVALSLAKKYGLNQFAFYDPYMSIEENSVEEVKDTIVSSFTNENFFVQFQPRVSCHTGEISYFEALVRIRKGGRIMYPDEFIHIAEDIKMMSQIDEWVLELACQEVLSWNKKDEMDSRISVNMSSTELNDPGIVERYLEIIGKYNLAPNMFSLEVNEKVISEDEYLTLGILNQFKEKGFSIVLDVDGFAFSSIENLTLFPIDTIKIQRKIISDLGHSKVSQIITQSLVMIGKEHGYKIVAEGVEDGVQFEFLKEIGCDEVQGFYFSKPKYADELVEFRKASYRFIN